MTDALTRMLDARDWLMADGATGTNLFNMGLSSGEPPEFWNIEKPENIRKLYGDAVAAGSDIFLTNTFGGNAARLKLHQAQGRVRELNRVGAALGREIADKAGRTVVVAGSMGPTGEIFEPMGSLTHALAVEIFHEQAEALKEGGADVLWVETISAPEDEKAIRVTLEKRYDYALANLKKLRSEDVFQIFMNAYAMSIEPHTNYLGPKAADDFDISMRLSLVGIGAVLAVARDRCNQ